MSQSPVVSGVVRVSATSGRRRVDLLLPSAVPVAELVPELARSVGLLDGATAHGGYRVVTADGRVLADDTGLTVQGVEDGAVLAVSAGVDERPPPVYDDVVEAMTDVVEHELRPWDATSGRRTSLAAATLLLALGAAALLLQTDAVLAGTAAAVVAAVLVGGAVTLSRAQDDAGAAVLLGWTAAAYGAVAGGLLVDGSAVERAAAAGAGAALAATACLLGLGAGRVLVLPPVAAGGVVLAVGLLTSQTSATVSAVLPVLTTVVVVLGSVFPWLALGATGTAVDQLYTQADVYADPDDVDRTQISADARLAHEILVAISATVGILLVVTVPVAVARGVGGTLLAVAASLVVMLRTRQYRAGTQVLVGLGAGVAGLVVTAVSVLVLHPDWRPATAVVLAAAGSLALVATLAPAGPSLRRGRLGDVLETVALVSLLPLLVVASGLLDLVLG